MADEKDGDQPAAQPLDLDALVERINAESDKRFRGLQSLMDQRDQEYRDQLESLRTSELSPEEQEQAQTSKLKQERDELKRQVELLSMRKDFPEEVDFISGFLGKSSYQDQLAALREFRKANAAAAPNGDETPEAAEGGEPTPVDGNNPPRKTGPSLADATSGKMTKELSDSILSTSSEKGILSRLRRNPG
jgi:hypothetical protein